jgi:hypothetical protein
MTAESLLAPGSQGVAVVSLVPPRQPIRNDLARLDTQPHPCSEDNLG